jgi:hypothetical protein
VVAISLIYILTMLIPINGLIMLGIYRNVCKNRVILHNTLVMLNQISRLKGRK